MIISLYKKQSPVIDPSQVKVSVDQQCQDQNPYFLVQQVYELHQ